MQPFDPNPPPREEEIQVALERDGKVEWIFGESAQEKKEKADAAIRRILLNVWDGQSAMLYLDALRLAVVLQKRAGTSAIQLTYTHPRGTPRHLLISDREIELVPLDTIIPKITYMVEADIRRVNLENPATTLDTTNFHTITYGDLFRHGGPPPAHLQTDGDALRAQQFQYHQGWTQQEPTNWIPRQQQEGLRQQGGMTGGQQRPREGVPQDWILNLDDTPF